MISLLEASFAHFNHIRQVPLDLRQQLPTDTGLSGEESIKRIVCVVGSQV